MMKCFTIVIPHMMNGWGWPSFSHLVATIHHPFFTSPQDTLLHLFLLEDYHQDNEDSHQSHSIQIQLIQQQY
jgi:hypothetical protein